MINAVCVCCVLSLNVHSIMVRVCVCCVLGSSSGGLSLKSWLSEKKRKLESALSKVEQHRHTHAHTDTRTHKRTHAHAHTHTRDKYTCTYVLCVRI